MYSVAHNGCDKFVDTFSVIKCTLCIVVVQTYMFDLSIGGWVNSSCLSQPSIKLWHNTGSASRQVSPSLCLCGIDHIKSSPLLVFGNTSPYMYICIVGLTVLFVGRDAALILMTFYMRYTTLPHPVRLFSNMQNRVLFLNSENLATVLGH